MTAHGRITLHAAAIERELADLHLLGGAADLEDVWCLRIANERAGRGREIEPLHEVEGVALDLCDFGEVVGLGLLGEGVHGAIRLDVELHAGLEGLVALHPDGCVASLGRLRDLGKGERRELQHGRFGVEARDAELFGILDDEGVLQ